MDVTLEQDRSLNKPFQLWIYNSCRGHVEPDDPLERSLLQTIRADPGIKRMRLHKAVGGHVNAVALAQALARLRDNGMVRCETVATGGRPGECWWPCEEDDRQERLIQVGASLAALEDDWSNAVQEAARLTREDGGCGSWKFGRC